MTPRRDYVETTIAGLERIAQRLVPFPTAQYQQMAHVAGHLAAEMRSYRDHIETFEPFIPRQTPPTPKP